MLGLGGARSPSIARPARAPAGSSDSSAPNSERAPADGARHRERPHVPSKPLRYCLEPSCSERVETGRCQAHARAQDRARGTSTERLYDSRWRSYSLRFRGRHPFCWYCLAQDRTTVAACVDHIDPHRGDRRRFWDTSNHAAACLACNTTKANTLERGDTSVDWRQRAMRGRAIEDEDRRTPTTPGG